MPGTSCVHAGFRFSAVLLTLLSAACGTDTTTAPAPGADATVPSDAVPSGDVAPPPEDVAADLGPSDALTEGDAPVPDVTPADGEGRPCGNGVADDGEACDGDALRGLTCMDLGFAGGELGCTAGCTLDTGACQPLTPENGNLVTYAGGGAGVRFHDVLRLSSGALLVAGAADHLAWLPAGVPVTSLGDPGVNSRAAGRLGFILELSADGRQVVRAVHFAPGTVADVFRMRTTEIPGSPTGELYVSGGRTVANVNDDGYYIAKLNGNFVDAVPTGATWARDVSAEPRRASGFEGTSQYKALQPWDVGGDGRVVYGMGAEYDFDWAAIGAFDADGRDAVVEHWTVHWSPAGEHRHVPASTVTDVERSGIVLKAGRGGSLRSHSTEDFEVSLPDGNGRMRPGRWPDDVFFSGPCLDNGRTCAGGPGHTGYRTSDKPTQRLGAIVIDRRDQHLYFGTSTQSRLPGGNPDFEPAVVAMDGEGRLKWWSRLYEEEGVSTPDQYVDGLAIDYASAGLVVLARAHGNNTINFWDGNEIAADPSARGFQNRFTGTSGNIHISWLGKFTLDAGALRHATWVAEPGEGLQGGVQMFDDSVPHLAGYPNPNAGWMDLNTTRCRADLEVASDGAVSVACTGRRTLTTHGAYQTMPLPGEGAGAWNQFVRTYTPDLSGVRYSSLLTGAWNTTDGTGGGNTWVQAIAMTPGGIVAVGWHETEAGEPVGAPMPTASVPDWGAAAPRDGLGIFARLRTEPAR